MRVRATRREPRTASTSSPEQLFPHVHRLRQRHRSDEPSFQGDSKWKRWVTTAGTGGDRLEAMPTELKRVYAPTGLQGYKPLVLPGCSSPVRLDQRQGGCCAPTVAIDKCDGHSGGGEGRRSPSKRYARDCDVGRSLGHNSRGDGKPLLIDNDQPHRFPLKASYGKDSIKVAATATDSAITLLQWKVTLTCTAATPSRMGYPMSESAYGTDPKQSG